MAHLQYIHPSKTHHHPHIPQSHLSSLISLACLFPSHTLLPRSSIHHSVAFVRVEGGEWVGWGAKRQPRSSSANVSVKPCLKQNLSWLTTVDRRDVQLWTLSSFLSLLALSPQLQHSQALGVEKSSYDGLGDRWRSSSHSPPSLVHDIGSECCSLLKSPSYLGRWPLDTPPSLLDTKWVVKVWLVWGIWSFYSYSYSTSKRTVLWFGSDSHRSIDRSRSKSIDPPGSSPHQSQAKCPRSLKDHHQVCCQAMMMISSLETTSGRPKEHVTLLYHALLIYPTLWELDGLRARWSRPIGQQNPSHPIHSPNLMSFRNQLLPSPRLSWHRWMVLRILELEPEDDCQALVWVDELGWEMRAVEDGVREVMRGMSSYIYGLRYDLVQRMTWKLFGQLSIRLSVSLLLTRLGWGSVDVSYRNEMYFTNSGPTYSLKLWFEWKVTRLPLLLDESR